ncbi:hypothetical protein C0Q70_13183 [Pomacea canaliculata]|uniref:CUB domain-containing protein n=1 Tax=Pomacea canaliculata TaxID=400727 RepID=A0A2T7NWJ7_POMCA|nr:hypothetical protein C0Q70_13183 [Pomacea canaliculata]
MIDDDDDDDDDDVQARDRDCGWSIQSASLDYVVHVTFVYVSIPTSRDCYSDYVQVYDGSSTLSNRLASVCGNEPGQEFYSYGRSLFIQFHSSTNNIPGGFHLSYESVLRSEAPPHAGGTEIVNVDLANEHFLKYPEGSSAYPNNANRGWVFYSTDPKYVVHIQFTQLDVELSATGCDFDYIEVFDRPNDEARSLGTFCGSRLLQFQSSLRSLYITFHSDTKGTRAGFRLTYQALGRWGEEPTADGSCSLYTPSLMAVSSADQFIQYPSSSLKDSRGGDCGWLLETDIADYVMHVNLSLVNIEAPSNSCVSDYIEVFDGSDDDAVSLGIVCGSRGHGFYSSGQSIYIRFHSNIGGSQLRLSYRAVANYKAPDEGSDVNIAGIAGGVLGGVALLAIVVATVVVVFIRQQCHLSTRNNPTNRRNNRTAV